VVSANHAFQVKYWFSASESGTSQKRPTKRAADLWESARFTSIFLASGFSCSQALSQPAHKPLTQTVRRFAESQEQMQVQKQVPH